MLSIDITDFRRSLAMTLSRQMIVARERKSAKLLLTANNVSINIFQASHKDVLMYHNSRRRPRGTALVGQEQHTMNQVSI